MAVRTPPARAGHTRLHHLIGLLTVRALWAGALTPLSGAAASTTIPLVASSLDVASSGGGTGPLHRTRWDSPEPALRRWRPFMRPGVASVRPCVAREIP